MVDDEVSSLCLLENVLQRLRFPHERKLTDPTRIIEEFDAYAPDLVITDIEMPEMDGIELVEKLRNHLPRDTCLPILVLTGSTNPQHKRRALAVGATDIIAKPFDSAEIQMRIRNLLEMRFQRLEIESHIRRHSGTLDIDSAPGRGTTFRLMLPFYQETSQESAAVRLTADRILRVLVVDDEPAARDVVAKYLKGDGHHVVTAANGGEAMQRVMNEHFDLVITDHGMPGLSGIQLANGVRRIDPAKHVILLTGFAHDPAQKPASVNCILKKPLVWDELRSAIQMLGKRAGECGALAGSESQLS